MGRFFQNNPRWMVAAAFAILVLSVVIDRCLVSLPFVVLLVCDGVAIGLLAAFSIQKHRNISRKRKEEKK